MARVVPTQSGRKSQDMTSQATAEGRVACLTRSTSGASIPAKMRRSSPPSAAEPAAGAPPAAHAAPAASPPRARGASARPAAPPPGGAAGPPTGGARLKDRGNAGFAAAAVGATAADTTLGGYSLTRAPSLDAAVGLARGCPILPH